MKIKLIFILSILANTFVYSQHYEVIKVNKEYKGESPYLLYIKLKITYTNKEKFTLPTFKNEVIKIGKERIYPFRFYAPLKILAYTNNGIELKYGFNMLPCRRELENHKIKIRCGESLLLYTNIFLGGFDVPKGEKIDSISIQFNSYNYTINSSILR